MEENHNLAALHIPIALYEGLSTQECAYIFLSINTKQKPVPRSLVYDLYGIADEQLVDAAATRARDIAMALHHDEDSPYFEQTKLPGSPRRKGGIALSTAVAAIKPLVEDKGDFEQRGISELEMQKKVVKNLFSALRELYESSWEDHVNAFMFASGFVGAIDFLRTKLLTYGQARSDYTKELFKDVLRSLKGDLILQQEAKGKGGKDAPNFIRERLTNLFEPGNKEPAKIRV
jgi:DGQHR domain-containing protein